MFKIYLGRKWIFSTGVSRLQWADFQSSKRKGLGAEPARRGKPVTVPSQSSSLRRNVQVNQLFGITQFFKNLKTEFKLFPTDFSRLAKKAACSLSTYPVFDSSPWGGHGVGWRGESSEGQHGLPRKGQVWDGGPASRTLWPVPPMAATVLVS